MKKLFVLLVSFCTVCLLAQVIDHQPYKLKGDVNGDGYVTAADVAVLADIVTKNQNEEMPRIHDTLVIHDTILVKVAEEDDDTIPYVDLGLSVKWATYNVGASKPEEYGLYFAWGETTGYTTNTNDGHSFVWTEYTMARDTAVTKYCTMTDWGIVDNKATLKPEDDAATTAWGSKWRMPTKAECDELVNDCTWTWKKLNGVNGYIITSKTNDNSIFLPANGYRTGSRFGYSGTNGYYRTSSLVQTANYNAYSLIFNGGSGSTYSHIRYDGQSVRAVRSE